MMKKLGSDWGGWLIETSLVRDNSVVVSAGLAHDITFDVALMEMNDTIKVIGIDPTPSSRQSVENLSPEFKDRFIYIDKALHGTQGNVSLGGDANSILQPRNTTMYQAVSLNEVMDGVDVSLLKMDIEGAECEVLLSTSETALKHIKFMYLEFHPWTPLDLYRETEKYLERIFNFQGFWLGKDNRWEAAYLCQK